MGKHVTEVPQCAILRCRLRLGSTSSPPVLRVLQTDAQVKDTISGHRLESLEPRNRARCRRSIGQIRFSGLSLVALAYAGNNVDQASCND